MTRPCLPAPRGPLTAWLTSRLTAEAHNLGPCPDPCGDPLSSGDEALALYCCYELHYRGFEDVDEDWEWEPSLLALRRRLEQRFLDAVRASLPTGALDGVEASDVGARLNAIIARPARSLSRYMANHGTRWQFAEFAVHRSAYQLKEADPHTWAIPRLHGDAKAALVRIQKDEYGDGDPDHVHAQLFANTLKALGLRADYGAYLDSIPAVTLSTVNLVSLFGLHRKWRGALVGHLAIFEMASVGPNGNYSRALRRLGYPASVREFYDVHVAADEIHQRVARDDMAVQLAADEPGTARDIIFGAEAVTALERMFTDHLLGAWATGRSSLRFDHTAIKRASSRPPRAA